MFKELKSFWKNYRYRFTPWQALNFNRHAVPIENQVQCLVINDDTLTQELRLLLKDFRPPNYICVFRDSAERREEFHICNSINTNVIRQNWGYELCLKRSGITGAGQGVFVQSGSISKGQIVALYSGTIYLPSQPILLPSIANFYIFKCSDGTMLDGKSDGISGMIYRSCHGRDRIGSVMPVCDISWFYAAINLKLHGPLKERSNEGLDVSKSPKQTPKLVNPLTIGQIVNNCNKEFCANVAYHELNISNMNFDFRLRPFLPNVNYTGNENNLETKVVPLIATKDISQGEELFSTYFTILNK